MIDREERHRCGRVGGVRGTLEDEGLETGSEGNPNESASYQWESVTNNNWVGGTHGSLDRFLFIANKSRNSMTGSSPGIERMYYVHPPHRPDRRAERRETVHSASPWMSLFAQVRVCNSAPGSICQTSADKRTSSITAWKSVPHTICWGMWDCYAACIYIKGLRVGRTLVWEFGRDSQPASHKFR
jgi:hypothetical protein